jgi:hypothetical protein
LKTGIVGGVGRCPACSKLVYGDPDICPHCKARIKTTGQKRKQREREESKKKSMRYAILAASACAIIFVWLAYRPVITMFRMVTVGYGRATLDERLRLFANHASGRFSDFRPYLDPAEDVDDEFVFVKTVFCGKQVDGDIDKVRKIVVESVELNDAKNEARIKAAVTVRIDNPRTRTGEMDNVRKVLGAGDREFTVNWKWVFKNGEWYYCGK